MNQQHQLSGLYQPEPFCLFQLKLALEVKGYGSFSCANALEGSGEAEFTLGFGFGFESVGVGGVLVPQQKGRLALVGLGGHCPRARSQAISYLVCQGPGIPPPPPEKGFSWFKMFLQRHLGAPGPPWIE